jgi:hypothetical protein
MNRDDDFDMPEMTDEILAEFRTPAPTPASTHTDLHMGAAVVRPVSKPKAKPFDISGVVVNAVIGTLCLAAAWLFVQAWAWVLFS